MKILGVDFGIKRVGLALVEEGGFLAYPLMTVERTTRDATFARILEVIEAEGVCRVVVGLPLAMDGSDTLTTRQARNFAASLGRRVDLPIDMMDERLTSHAAEQELRECGMKSKKRKKALDSQAAVHILQAWLSSNA